MPYDQPPDAYYLYALQQADKKMPVCGSDTHGSRYVNGHMLGFSAN